MLVASSAAMGYLVSHKLSKRVAFLEQFLHFIAYIETEIRYSSTLITEIIRGYKTEKELGCVLHEFYKILGTTGNINTSWDKAVRNTYKNFGLNLREAETVINFIYNLGTNDTEGQMKYCKFNYDLISDYLKIAKDEKRKKSKLYFMLYTSAGLCLTLSIV